MRRKLPDRIIGRYNEQGRPDPRGRRVIYVRGGQRGSETFSTAREAGDFTRTLQAEIEGSASLTISDAIDLYISAMERAGLAEITIRHRPAHLLRFFDGGQDLVSSLTPKRVAALYQAQVGSGCATATHHLGLRCARAFLAWASGRRNKYGVPGANPPLLPADPSVGMQPEGQAGAGKAQPRVDEARRLVAACDRLALERLDSGACAVMTLIFTGARLREITTRQIRDLDADATILWMPASSRTKKRPPHREIHEPLRSHLRRLSAGRAPDELLFRAGRSEKSHSSWLGKHLRRLCTEAGIPRVVPQALRGLHESLAIKGRGVQGGRGGAGPRLDVARRAYHQPGVEQEAPAAAVLSFLNRSHEIPPSDTTDGAENNS